MSRLLSRFGVRALAVVLLLVGALGGYYLGTDRQHQQQANPAQLAANTERELPTEDYQARMSVSDERRVARQEATRRANEAAKAEAARARKAEQAARKKRAATQNSTTTASKPYTGPIPASCQEYSGNRAIGCAILLESGFQLDQMPCLDKLWTRESGWNPRAANPSSGAYGIPQALPGSKMASAGADWQTNPATQIKWGLGYIKSRYGTPCGAWSKLQTAGWY